MCFDQDAATHNIHNSVLLLDGLSSNQPKAQQAGPKGSDLLIKTEDKEFNWNKSLQNNAPNNALRKKARVFEKDQDGQTSSIQDGERQGKKEQRAKYHSSIHQKASVKDALKTFIEKNQSK